MSPLRRTLLQETELLCGHQRQAQSTNITYRSVELDQNRACLAQNCEPKSRRKLSNPLLTYSILNRCNQALVHNHYNIACSVPVCNSALCRSGLGLQERPGIAEEPAIFPLRRSTSRALASSSGTTFLPRDAQNMSPRQDCCHRTSRDDSPLRQIHPSEQQPRAPTDQTRAEKCVRL